MPRENSSLLFLIILFLLIGLIGLGFIALNREWGGTLKGGVITDEINCLTANISDDFNSASIPLNITIQLNQSNSSEELEFPWLFITVIGAIAGISYFTLIKIKTYRKEKRINLLLKKVVREPMTSNFGDIESLTSHSEDPRLIIENPFEPTNFSLEYYQYQRYAGQLEGFEFTFLLRLFNSILRRFPTLNQYIEGGINKLVYLMEVKSLTYEEQISIFKDFINYNSEIEIRLQLNKLMIELNNSENRTNWEVLLPKFNYCYDLSQIVNDPEFTTDLLLMAILIKN